MWSITLPVPKSRAHAKEIADGCQREENPSLSARARRQLESKCAGRRVGVKVTFLPRGRAVTLARSASEGYVNLLPAARPCSGGDQHLARSAVSCLVPPRGSSYGTGEGSTASPSLHQFPRSSRRQCLRDSGSRAGIESSPLNSWAWQETFARYPADFLPWTAAAAR